MLGLKNWFYKGTMIHEIGLLDVDLFKVMVKKGARKVKIGNDFYYKTTRFLVYYDDMYKRLDFYIKEPSDIINPQVRSSSIADGGKYKIMGFYHYNQGVMELGNMNWFSDFVMWLRRI